MRPEMTGDSAEASEAELAAEIGFHLPARYNAARLLFDNLAAGRGDKVAIYSDHRNWTYAELAEEARRIGAALLARGLESGDRVALFLDDTPLYPAAIMGALHAGLVPVLLNTLSPADQARFYIEDSGARAVLVEAEFQALFSAEALSGLAVEAIFVANGVARVAGSENWSAIAEQPAELTEASTAPDDPAFWMYSSGSTGRPKGVVHRHGDAAYTAASYASHFLELTADDICFSVPKIFFAYGFGNSVTFPFAVGAASVLLAGRPTPANVFEQFARYRPTVFFGLPTLYTALAKDAAAARADFSSLRLCISAAEILSNDIFSAWRQRCGLEIVEGLGSTEVLHIYLSNSNETKKSGAAGRRVPGYALKLTDGDGTPTAEGEEGILWVKGASNARCYWNRPDKTAETMRDGWIYTGDRFQRDAEGFYFFRGRADELVKVSGLWVYPLEVELTLAEHPKVRECAVLAVELPDRRTTLKAFVVPEVGVAIGTQFDEELKAFVKARLLPYKYPRQITYLETLPKTGSGKIDRQALSATENQR